MTNNTVFVDVSVHPSDLVFSENFKELLDEQRKTNQLLVDSMKDPSLGSSIKQNLGEILNASRLASQGEKFQKLRILQLGNAFLRAPTPLSVIRIFLRSSSYLA